MPLWYFRNNKRTFTADKFRPKSSFNPRNKDAIIETYLNCLKERLLDIEVPSKRYNNLTKDEHDALYSLKDDPSIILKDTDIGSVVVVWDRDDREVYEEAPNVLINTMMKALEKIRLCGYLSNDTLDYFLVKNPKFARFYLLPKIHKHLHDVLGTPVIANSSFYNKNISSILDYHLQPLAQRVKSYIKDTNQFLNKIKKIVKLPEEVVLCAVDVVGHYPEIPHGEGLASLC